MVSFQIVCRLPEHRYAQHGRNRTTELRSAAVGLLGRNDIGILLSSVLLKLVCILIIYGSTENDYPIPERFAVSVGGAPIEVLIRYIKNQEKLLL